jgi:diaminopimelate decarboxylase
MVSTPARERINSGRQYLPAATPNPSPNQHLLPLTAKVNPQDHLEVGGCDVPQLAQQFGTPLYILDEETLRIACRQYKQAFQTYYPGESLVIYASKAWNCLAVCAIAADEGLGIDVVSGGELYTALQAGVKPELLYMHGNNKSVDELRMAIAAHCTIVVDNWLELKTLVELAESPVSIMLRLTPGIECHTHEYIRTGHLDSKFGFDPDQIEQVFEFVAQQPNLNCIGIHAHIGSQIFELQPHHDLTSVMVQWFKKGAEHGLAMQELDIGGGLGICYTEADDPPSIDAWAKVICDGMIKACAEQQVPLPKIIAEPGRSLIGSACVTAYTVGSQKVVPGLRTYVTVDGGMSDNPRPITYQSVYRSVVANQMSAAATETVAIAGKHCESGDIVIKEASLPPTQPGDTIVIPATGAYNYSMASNYNRLPRPAAILVKDGEASVIIQRENYQDLMRQDRLPDRLGRQESAS